MYLQTNHNIMEVYENALDNSVIIFRIKALKEDHDFSSFLLYCIGLIRKKLRKYLSSSMTYKCQLSSNIRLQKYDNEIEKWIEHDPIFNSRTFKISKNELSKDLFDIAKQEMENSYDMYLFEGSGWLFKHANYMEIKLIEYEPFHAGTHTSLPYEIQRTHACLNIKCYDNKCFVYCILARLFRKKKNPSRISNYKHHFKTICTERLFYPVTLNQLSNFEDDNPLLSINIIQLYKGKFIPVYHTKKNHIQKLKEINLLMYENHFFLINSMSRLLFKSLPIKRKKWYFCHYCLSRFQSLKKKEAHNLFCQKKLQRQIPPPKGSKITFKNFTKQILVPFIIYYDIECILEPKANSSKEDVHRPISICSLTKSIYNEYNYPPVIFTGINCVYDFIRHLFNEMIHLTRIYSETNYVLTLDKHSSFYFENTQNCDFCGTYLSTKYIDHDHLQNGAKKSNFRYVLCNRCNLTYASNKLQNLRIPVVAHNANKYDLHFLIPELVKLGHCKIIPKNNEHYMAIYFKNLVFIDSINFLSGSLSDLTLLLKKNNADHLKKYINFISSDKKLQLLLEQKGVMCYEWLDSMDKLKAESLPPKQAFYNSLLQSEISLENYAHAKKVWQCFNCKYMSDYLELYLKLDVILLAAVFDHFRITTHKDFKLDPAAYVSLPGLSYDAMLLQTKTELDSLPETEMFNFVHAGIRGGICGISHRYAEANNEFCSDYDQTKPETYIIGFDLNNLYGWALSNHLPQKKFRWLNKYECMNFDLMSISRYSPNGYFLEVDLEYPKYLHDLHSDLPLAPEKLYISPDKWSKATKFLASICNVNKNIKSEKLVCTLYNKKHYIIHYITLQLYINLGLQIQKIHRILEFEQSPWAKPYIEYCTRKRQEAMSSFESNIYKLMCNSLYGRLMMNESKQTIVKLITKSKQLKKLTAKPNFKSCRIINENLVSVHLDKDVLCCLNPIYAGVAVLDLSKELFYKFHYLHIKNSFDPMKIKFLMGDTDSYIYHITKGQFDQNIYQHIKSNPQYFDCSSYHVSSSMFSDQNKKKVGFIKDMYAPAVPKTFIGLKSKMYAVELACNNLIDKKVKGLSRTIIRNLQIEHFKKALWEHKISFHNFHLIGSKHHQVETKYLRKIGLSPFDDKRYLLDDMISSIPYGHYTIEKDVVKKTD